MEPYKLEWMSVIVYFKDENGKLQSLSTEATFENSATQIENLQRKIQALKSTQQSVNEIL